MNMIAVILTVLVFFPSLVLSGVIKNYSNSFFGVYGKKASVMGKVDGSALETWIYPYKVLHDFQVQVLVGGVEENPYQRLGNFHFSPSCFERNFIGEKWTLAEQIYPAYNEPAVFLVYRVQALTDITLEFFFKPDLSPMWPASLGGKYSYFDEDGNFFLLSESSSKNFAFFGGFKGEKVGDLPAHHLPGGRLRYRIPLKKGFHEIPLTAVAASGKYEDIKTTFRQVKEKYSLLLKEREEMFGTFFKDHLAVKTPDAGINEALRWAILNVHTAFADNPDLGEGLVAGYGLSGERERPGFGWYFGGDGLINSFALVNYGDFAGARKELEFLLKYQREDGKIMHELSQGAKFINWFGDYGFPYFHGDTTLYFAAFLDFYLKRTGDIDFIVKNTGKIDKLFSWMLNCDADKDGIVEAKLAGVGASETGPLRLKMKTDIFLASLSVSAWEAMADIYSLLKDPRKAEMARERLNRSKPALEKFFWDEESQYYDYAVKEDGSVVKEITIWPAIAMRFKVLAEDRGRVAQRRIASPELSADWGTRFLSSQSGYYDPSSYNNGAVWPFLTGFSSLALYNYGNPYHGFSLLQANLDVIMDYDYGAPAELLSGDIYRPVDESVPNQIWSSGNTISAFVEGLLGFSADAVKKEIYFKPAIPLSWPGLEVDNLKVGNGTLRFKYRRSRTGNMLEYIVEGEDLKDYRLVFDPEILAMSKRLYVILDGQPVQPPVTGRFEESKATLRFWVDMQGFVYPWVKKDSRYGAFSKGPIIEDIRFENPETGYVIYVWGKGLGEVEFFTDCTLECPGGAFIPKEDGVTLELNFGDRWERSVVTAKWDIDE